MGIPTLYRWLEQHHKSIVTSSFTGDKADTETDQFTSELSDSDVEEITSEPVDYLFVDWNCGIHPAARTTTPDKIYQAINKYLDCLVATVNPRKLLFIAVDGVAPRAKQVQQRQRRYHSKHMTSYTNSLKRDFGLDLPATQVDYNMISPGTSFMDQLTKETKKHIEQKMDGPWKHLTVVFSDASVPGEGEHKIMQYIRDLPASDKSSIVVYGMDADLIMLCLTNFRPKMALVREKIHFGRSAKDDHVGDSEAQFCYLSIDRLRDALLSVLSPSTTLTMLENWKIFCNKTTKELYQRYNMIKQKQLVNMKKQRFGNDPINMIRDYILICFFLGNDFIHRLPSLSIKDGGLEIVLIVYKVTQMERLSYLTDPVRGLDLEFLIRMFELLNQVEAAQLRYIEYRRTKRIETFKQRRSYKNGTPYERKLMEFECIEQRTSDCINLGSKGWKERYYSYFFKLTKVNKKMYHRNINQICYRYLEGVLWVWNYYTQGCSNWGWHQTDVTSPTTGDFYQYLKTLRSYKIELPSVSAVVPPMQPLEQLLMILPPSSAQLLPEHYSKLLTDNRSPLIGYYPPGKTRFFAIGRSYLHECPMDLPEIDYRSVKLATAAIPKHQFNLIRSIPDHAIEPGLIVYAED